MLFICLVLIIIIVNWFHLDFNSVKSSVYSASYQKINIRYLTLIVLCVIVIPLFLLRWTAVALLKVQCVRLVSFQRCQKRKYWVCRSAFLDLGLRRNNQLSNKLLLETTCFTFQLLVSVTGRGSLFAPALHTASKLLSQQEIKQIVTV